MNFEKDILLKKAGLLWVLFSSVVGVLPFFGLDGDQSVWSRAMIGGILSLLLISIGLYVIAKDLYGRVKAPVAVRKVVEGSHYYQGYVIVILDKSSWVDIGQLLVLVVSSDDTKLPLALLNVVTKTTSGYPQCVVLKPLSESDIQGYLSDASRWKSLKVFSDMQCSYLEK